MSGGGARPASMAMIDGGSFVLGYDLCLIEALATAGAAVTLYASRTRYNGDLLERIAALPHARVRAYDVSRTVAPRWKGLLNYAKLWCDVWRERRSYDIVNLQFSAFWPLEVALASALRGRFVYTPHNAVPHSFRGRRHRPTAWLAARARRIVVPSEHTRSEFVSRYGPAYAARTKVAPIGLMPVGLEGGPVAYSRPPSPSALVYWSNVKPYKGVELFVEMASDPAVAARGLALEVWGAFDPALAALRGELRSLGVRIEDRFLDVQEVRTLLARDVVFVLPYRDASQSGAFYTLLAHGAWFVAADVGDIGGFLRRHGLEALLLEDRSAASVVAALDRIARDGASLAARLRDAQADASWQAAARVYISAAS